MLSAPPARSKQPTRRICPTARPPSCPPRPGPGPNCPPNPRRRPITGGAKSYRCACHWTAAAGHHAIPAAVWTVSLAKSNHLSGNQPGQAPPRRGKLCSVEAAPQRSLPRSSFGSDQSALPSVHSDGTRARQSAGCCHGCLLLGPTPSLTAIPPAFDNMAPLCTGKPVLQLDHPPGLAQPR